MALFLTILEGESASDARPILASRDERLINVVASELANRFKSLDKRQSKLSCLLIESCDRSPTGR
jgi:hypothetical protein